LHHPPLQVFQGRSALVRTQGCTACNLEQERRPCQVDVLVNVQAKKRSYAKPAKRDKTMCRQKVQKVQLYICCILTATWTGIGDVKAVWDACMMVPQFLPSRHHRLFTLLPPAVEAIALRLLIPSMPPPRPSLSMQLPSRLARPLSSLTSPPGRHLQARCC
jgi:hypothetical protein